VNSSHKSIHTQKSIPLAGHTTIGLGGPAAEFTSCTTVDQVREALVYAREQHLRVQILGGGSNVVFADRGFDGLVLKIDLRGVKFNEVGDQVSVVAGAGENWDDLVKRYIDGDLAGIECLSGIPGLVGATPIQNVGAYGQEVCDTIVSVTALERKSLELIQIPGSECRFGYRQSRFKSDDKNRFIITEVCFRLTKFGKPQIRYSELQQYVESRMHLNTLANGKPALDAVRSAVLALRRRKSMVIDPADPNSRSVGSFFVNPILSKETFATLEEQWKQSGHEKPVPVFPVKNGMKVPAAWLVENAGFARGYRRNGAGISANHSLALINCAGTTKDLLELAGEIENTVHQKFGIRLQREAVVVE